MNKIRFRFAIAALACILSSVALRAQTALQRMTFSLQGQYQTNIFSTNSDNLTNVLSDIHTIRIGTGELIKALAIDLEGTNWTKFNGGNLYYAINLTNGLEGMILRNGTNEADVSSFFQGSFSNNFTALLTNEFPSLNGETNLAMVFTNVVTNISTNGGVTNIFTNVFTNSTAAVPNTIAIETPLYHGWRRQQSDLIVNTNFSVTSGLYFFSFSTTNLKFNLLGVGPGASSNLVRTVDGTTYSFTNLTSEFVGTAGAFYLNVASNNYSLESNTYYFVTGPMHGSIGVGGPSFNTNVTPP